MPKIQYQDLPILRNVEQLKIVKVANQIIASYQAQGYLLTIRQLYYQFVSRDLIKNNMREYKKLASIINDARLAGLMDWSAIEDRTRNLESLSHWSGPDKIIEACGEQFNLDRWETQPNRVEVWIEKDALAGVIEGVCKEYDVPYLSCRGYTSQSEMWVAGQRLLRYFKAGQTPIILHFGDHDPSGIDMTRDIQDRLELFTGHPIDLRRKALNEDQIDEYHPPPNPAKVTDSRAKAYIQRFGHESWELDALEPAVLSALIGDEIESILDQDAWAEINDRQSDHRAQLATVAERFDEVVTFLNGEA